MALPDVLAMERVLKHQDIRPHLAALSIRSPHEQTYKLWIQQKRIFMRAASLIIAIGKHKLTSTQAKKLDYLGFTFNSLSLLCQQYGGTEEFRAALKERGVRSKPLREKLMKALHTSPAKVASPTAPLLPGWLQQCRYLLQCLSFFFTPVSSQSHQ